MKRAKSTTHRIHVWYISLHFFDFYGFHVGKCASPMDPIYNPDEGIHTFFSAASIRRIAAPTCTGEDASTLDAKHGRSNHKGVTQCATKGFSNATVEGVGFEVLLKKYHFDPKVSFDPEVLIENLELPPSAAVGEVFSLGTRRLFAPVAPYYSSDPALLLKAWRLPGWIDVFFFGSSRIKKTIRKLHPQTLGNLGIFDRLVYPSSLKPPPSNPCLNGISWGMVDGYLFDVNHQQFGEFFWVQPWPVNLESQTHGVNVEFHLCQIW